jgi:hypothetical protein
MLTRRSSIGRKQKVAPEKTGFWKTRALLNFMYSAIKPKIDRAITVLDAIRQWRALMRVQGKNSENSQYIRS